MHYLVNMLNEGWSVSFFFKEDDKGNLDKNVLCIKGHKDGRTTGIGIRKVQCIDMQIETTTTPPCDDKSVTLSGMHFREIDLVKALYILHEWSLYKRDTEFAMRAASPDADTEVESLDQ